MNIPYTTKLLIFSKFNIGVAALFEFPKYLLEKSD